jgi:hypothetical protein
MNGRAGWTQALMLKGDGDFLHITSSASPDAPANPSKNQILFAAAKLDFSRYEAEDASREGSSVMRDPSMSNGAKTRLGAKDIGRLSFRIHVAKQGAYRLAVNYGDIGFPSTPRLSANGQAISGSVKTVQMDPALAASRSRDLGTRSRGERYELSGSAQLKAGDNQIEVLGGPYALDIDYLEITPAQ